MDLRLNGSIIGDMDRELRKQNYTVSSRDADSRLLRGAVAEHVISPNCRIGRIRWTLLQCSCHVSVLVAILFQPLPSSTQSHLYDVHHSSMSSKQSSLYDVQSVHIRGHQDIRIGTTWHKDT